MRRERNRALFHSVRKVPHGLFSLILGALLAAAVGGCKTLLKGDHASTTQNSVSFASQDERRDFIRSAKVWSKPAQDISAQDLSVNDPSCNVFRPDDVVTCVYVPPKRDGGGAGWTPKFRCVDAQQRILKVKYGKTSAEVYHEVFAARLLQALGFKADCDYPVKKVICEHCPAEPFTYTNLYRLGKENPNEEFASREFDAAMIEIPFAETTFTETVDGKTKEGWGFHEIVKDEFKSPDPEQNHAREALTLLMAVIQHVDNRRDNQALVCKVAAKSVTDCPPDERYLLVADLGSTLGAFKIARAQGDSGMDIPPSLSYFFWDHAPIWRNWAGAKSGGCIAHLIAYDTIEPATLKQEPITEAGRKFLGELLHQLSDGQLRQLVVYARLSERQPVPNVNEEMWMSIAKMQPWSAPFKFLPFSPINDKPVSTDQWVATLRKKIGKVLEVPCDQ